MGLFQGMSEEGSAGQFLQPGEIARVIEVAVSQEDGFDIRPVQADLTPDFLQSRDFACQACVDQHRFIPGCVIKEME